MSDSIEKYVQELHDAHFSVRRKKPQVIKQQNEINQQEGNQEWQTKSNTTKPKGAKSFVCTTLEEVRAANTKTGRCTTRKENIPCVKYLKRRVYQYQA